LDIKRLLMRASAEETLGCELGRGKGGAEGEEGSGNGGGDCKKRG